MVQTQKSKSAKGQIRSRKTTQNIIDDRLFLNPHDVFHKVDKMCFFLIFIYSYLLLINEKPRLHNAIGDVILIFDTYDVIKALKFTRSSNFNFCVSLYLNKTS